MALLLSSHRRPFTVNLANRTYRMTDEVQVNHDIAIFVAVELPFARRAYYAIHSNRAAFLFGVDGRIQRFFNSLFDRDELFVVKLYMAEPLRLDFDLLARRSSGIGTKRQYACASQYDTKKLTYH